MKKSLCHLLLISALGLLLLACGQNGALHLPDAATASSAE